MFYAISISLFYVIKYFSYAQCFKLPLYFVTFICGLTPIKLLKGARLTKILYKLFRNYFSRVFAFFPV